MVAGFFFTPGVYIDIRIYVYVCVGVYVKQHNQLVSASAWYWLDSSLVEPL